MYKPKSIYSEYKSCSKGDSD